MGNVIVSIIVGAAVGAAVYFIVRNRKKGCGCGCQDCAMKDNCRKKD